MTDLKGRIAVVTGANSGIGQEIAIKLVKQGMKVVGCGRNEDKLKSVEEKANKMGPGKMYSVRCDVSKEEDILVLFKYVKEKFSKIHVMVNNAGLAHQAPLLSGDVKEWKNMFKVNVLGLCICTQQACKLMEESKVEDGHIVNLNSLAGHNVFSQAVFYSSTKFAVTALTEGLRQELRAKKSKTRVTAISPGVVKTPFIPKFMKADQASADAMADQMGFLRPEDVADSVVYALKSPVQMDVHEIVLKTNNSA